MLWLALYWPALPLAPWLTATPDAHDTPPLAIDDRHRVHCACPRAQAHGVRTGMSTATARTLCDDLRLRARDQRREQAWLATQAQRLRRWTPQVCLDRGEDGDDALLLEIGGSLRLFHGLHALLDGVRTTLPDGPGPAGLALAATPGAAALLARAGRDTTALAGDDGRLDHPALQRALATLPLATLGLDLRIRERLMNMGLHHLGELDALPRATLARRFGREFTHWLDRVTGRLPDLRTPLPPETFFVRELHFLDGIAHSNGLLFPMQHLLGQFGDFLRQRQLAGWQLVWRLTLVDRRTQDLVVRTSRPATAPAHFLALTRVQLETLRLDAPVETLRLVCRRFVPLPADASDLFPEAGAAQEAGLGDLLDRLRARLGDTRCRRLAARDRLRPEAAQQIAGPGLQDDPGPLPPPRRRPLWLLRTPQAASWQDGTLHWHGELELLDGPERLDGEWWSTPLRRDYFTARHRQRLLPDADGNPREGGPLYWVFHDLATDAWYVHGVFG